MTEYVEDRDDSAGDYGPLGPGHAPAKDPMKGLRGVMAGAMCMELITFLLVFPVVMQVGEGQYASAFNYTFVGVFCALCFVAMFLQKRPWALWLDAAIQVVAIAGFIVHPSMGIMGVIYAVVWGYIFYLRKNLIERMKRGLLVTQHT